MYPYEFGFREVGPVSVVCDASKPGSPISNSSDTAFEYITGQPLSRRRR
jgi:hypothetical protein